MSPQANYMKAEERRAATVAIVVTLAAERNPSEISTTDIAKAMGVTQGALFKHFPTKDAIVQAVIQWVADKLLSRIEQAEQSKTAPIEAIEAMFFAHIRFVSEYPGAPRMLFSELQRKQPSVPKQIATTLLKSYSARIQRLLEDGKTQGLVRTDLDTNAAASLLIGTIQGLVMQSLLVNNISLMHSQAPKVFDIYRHGIEVSYD
ncbi:TetR/AcrR family transcriptional regulator [Pseudidiomarina salilacus]|uniref:TetR/AcrR family transcriptional regulator n=1 Tax=Pseudidiomarina salilacus TaxID=3384452 RepID=UPI0039848433